MKKIIITTVFSLFLVLAACTTSPTVDPPATLQAAVAGSQFLTEADWQSVEVLQEKVVNGGQMMLYSWSDTNQQTCLSAAYLTTINNEWQTRDTLSSPCQSETNFIAAYNETSYIEAPFGPPRHTTVYGMSQIGHAVRIVWADGQVTHVPLENGTFLENRSGNWTVERVELLDQDNNLLDVADWAITAAQ